MTDTYTVGKIDFNQSHDEIHDPREALFKISNIASDFIDTKDTIDINKVKKEINRKSIKMIHHVFTLFEDANKTNRSCIVDFVTDLFFCLSDIMNHKDWMIVTHDKDKETIIYSLHKHNKLRIKITDNELFNDRSGWSIEVPQGKIAIVANDHDNRFKIQTPLATIRNDDFNLIAVKSFTSKLDAIVRSVVDYLNIVE